MFIFSISISTMTFFAKPPSAHTVTKCKFISDLSEFSVYLKSLWIDLDSFCTEWKKEKKRYLLHLANRLCSMFISCKQINVNSIILTFDCLTVQGTIAGSFPLLTCFPHFDGTIVSISLFISCAHGWCHNTWTILDQKFNISINTILFNIYYREDVDLISIMFAFKIQIINYFLSGLIDSGHYFVAAMTCI